MIAIYTHIGQPRVFVEPGESSEQVCELMGQDVVNLSFSLPLPVAFAPGDYITIFGKRYSLNTPATETKIASRNYEYSLVLDSDLQNLGKVIYLFLDRFNRFTETEFSLTGTPKDFLDLLISNLKRIYPGYDYKIGYVIDGGTKTLDFSGNNCLEVLNKLASDYETEWFIEGNKISLYKRQTNSGILLSYGKGNGLYAHTISPQTNSNPVTRIYAYGSDKNIGSNYRLGAKRLRMNGALYLEKNTDKYGVIEIRKIFEDVYPRRVGTVSGVDNPFIFTDNSMDFNVNDWLMPSEIAKVTFNTGVLAGLTFAINNYNSATKTFKINANTDSQTLEAPSELLKPAIGDTYVLIDILMPNQYIVNAEAELKQKAQAFLDESSIDVPITVKVVCDPINFKNTGRTVVLGQMVTVKDDLTGFNRSIRVIKYTRNLRRPSLYSMDLADKPKENTLIKIINP